MVNLYEYTSSDVYTKPNGLIGLLVCCVGGGGGGGGGRKGGTSNSAGGGAGGTGAVVTRYIPAADVPASVTVTIGAGGTAGAIQATANTHGNNGSDGGNTSFGSLVVANGGKLGSGGTKEAGNAGIGGDTASCVPAWVYYALSGVAGSSGTVTFGSPGTSASVTVLQAGAGGGGGVRTTPTESAGGSSGLGRAKDYATTVAAIAGGLAGGGAGGNGGNNVFLGLLDIFGTSTVGATIGLGQGGSGAGSSLLTDGGTGGNGGLYGAGGGGGGASRDGNGGAGGAGAQGCCLILEVK